MSASHPPEGAGSERRAEPESFRARALQASLTVNDLPVSVAWYRDALGFTVAMEREREGKLHAVAIVAGAVRLLLNQDDGGRGWDRTKGEGFSLMLTTTQDIDALANRVKQHGDALDTEPMDAPWGPRIFRVRDPDGFKLTIASEQER